MESLTGTKVFVFWVLWAVLLGALRSVFVDIGIALPLPTIVVLALSRTLGLIAYPVLYAPPLILTFVWWRRRRRLAAAPG